MALIQNRGQSPDGSQPLIPVSGSVFTFQGTVPNGSSKSTGWFSTASYDSLGFVFRSNKTGYYTLEYSEDKSTVFMPVITVQYVDVNQRRKGAVDQDATWCRIVWYNNSGSDATLSMRVNQKTGSFQPSLETLGAIGADTRLAMWCKNTIHITDNSGVYGDVARTGNALNVNVTNPTGATDVSALAKDQTLTNGSQRVAIVNGNNQIYGSQASPLNVSIPNTDFPNAAIGTINDTPVTDQTKTGTVIALLKGLLAETIPAATTGTFTQVTLAANVQQTIVANPNRKQVIISSVSGTVLIAVGFNATANNWSYRIVTNGTVEIDEHTAPVSISLFSTSSATVNVTQII